MFWGNFNSQSMTRTRSYTYLITISCSFHLENVFQLWTGLDHSCQGNVIVIELGSWLVSQIVHDVSLCVYWRIFMKIFVSATECCRRNKSHKFCLIWFFATCCCDKILLRRQRFSQKFFSTHKPICHCDWSLPHVATTCRLVCTDL